MKNVPHKFRRAALDVTEGGFYTSLDRHFALFTPRGGTCVVTFDNMKSRDMPPPRTPWGSGFCRKHGYSHLGIMMTRRNDWFRHKALMGFFDGLVKDRFFDQFDSVVFYGSSMGGYGAMVYAGWHPPARAVAFQPQTSLCPDIVPWETRYRAGYARGDNGLDATLDAAKTLRNIRNAQVFFDPYAPLDRAHADRIDFDNVDLMKCRFMGHKITRHMMHADILRDIVTQAIDGTLTQDRFASVYRHRRRHAAYFRNVAMRAYATRPALGDRAVNWAERTRPDWKIPHLKRLRDANVTAPSA